MPGLLSSLKAAGIAGPEALKGIVRGLRPVSGFGDIDVSDADEGLNVGRGENAVSVKNAGAARIAATGPSGQADWPDERYWIAWQAAGDSGPGARVSLTSAAVYDPPITIASNLDEMTDDGTVGTHLLKAGAKVWVWIIEGAGGNAHYVFSRTSTPYIDAIITGYSQDGSNKRWIYAFSEAEKTSTGYGGWAALTEGIIDNCYNRAEDINGATGLMGNGVTLPLTGTFDLQPIPMNTPVRLDIVPVSGGVEYWFNMTNGIDGACAE